MAKRSPEAAAEIATYDRYAQVLELRAQGFNFAQIAAECGYSDASGASKAYHKALAIRPVQNADQLREQEAVRLEYCWKKTAEIIENPPPAHSAIGKVVVNPVTGEIIRDESVKVRAIDLYKKLSESYRKLTGIDLAVKPQEPSPEEEAVIREALDYSRQLIADNQRLTAEVARLEAQVRVLEGSVPADVVMDGDSEPGPALGGYGPCG